MSESERIRREYARRAERVPSSRYAASSPAQLFMRQIRERAVLRLLADAGRIPLAGAHILEIGCGQGQWLVDFETWGATRRNLAGIDLISPRVELAQARLSDLRTESGAVVVKGADIRVGDASRLPWPDDSQDIVLQSMVFSSILNEDMRRQVASEMTRVLAPRGVILWNDFFVGNPSNANLRGVGKAEISRLFPGFERRLRRITLAPPVARWIVPASVFIAEMMERTTLLNTQYVGLLWRSAAEGG